MTLKDFYNKLINIAKVGILKSTANTPQGLTARVETFAGVDIDEVPIMQQYGLFAQAPNGSIVMICQITGDPSNTIAIAPTHLSSRPDSIESGEVIIYSQFGQTIHLKNDGDIAIETANNISISCETMDITATNINFNSGNIKVGNGASQPIARQGDSTSDGGTITSGSNEATG